VKSFQVAQLAYDVTVRFCGRYIEKCSRTRDQMVQAARSGVQNIAEGSQASGTSKKTELKLTSVARASLEELRLDYEDYLRQHALQQWPREDARRAALIARRPATADDVTAWVLEVHDGQHGQGGLGGQSGPNKSPQSPQSPFRPQSPPMRNLRQWRAGTPRGGLQPARPQIVALGNAFVDEGGFTERLCRVRSERRTRR